MAEKKEEKRDRKHGRRGDAEETEAPRPVQKGWGEETIQKDVPEKDVGFTEVPTLDPNDDTPHEPRADQEDMSREVAAAPQDYHSLMPKLAELDQVAPGVTKWNLAANSDDVDLSVLTQALSAQLDDEDVPWNSDMLLVQLTSELVDAQERRAARDGSPTAAEAAVVTKQRG